MKKRDRIKELLRIGVCSNCYDRNRVCSGYKEKCSARDDHRYIIENLLNNGIGDIKVAQKGILHKLKAEIASSIKPTHNESQQMYDSALEDVLLFIDAFINKLDEEQDKGGDSNGISKK